MDELRTRHRQLWRVAGRTAAFSTVFIAAMCLTGSAIAAPVVDLQWVQPTVWPQLSQSDDPAVNCGIAGAAGGIGACVIDGGKTVVVSSAASESQAKYLALVAVGTEAFTEAGVTWDACDVDAWAGVHGASAASIKQFSAHHCR